MEHVKSTIFTTAVLVTGLITAAQILHPRDAASEMRSAGLAQAARAETAWSDPPARVTPPTAQMPARPASFTLLPLAMTASLSASEPGIEARSARRAEPGKGRKTVLAGIRSRPAAGQGPRATRTSDSDQTAGAPGPIAKVDPIGGLLKALGIGRDG